MGCFQFSALAAVPIVSTFKLTTRRYIRAHLLSAAIIGDHNLWACLQNCMPDPRIHQRGSCPTSEAGTRANRNER